MIKTEILVIGTGLAGCVAALAAANKGKEVIIITKSNTLLSGNTPYAQGGIIYKSITDDKKKLVNDILKAGSGHCNIDAVQQLVSLGPELVEKYLFDISKVNFDKNEDNTLSLTNEGAHSEHRIIHSKDRTGLDIAEAITEAVQKHPNIKVKINCMIVDLLTLSHHSSNSLDIYKKPACFGASILNIDDGKISPIYAANTILATGGIGQIYSNTTNPEEATGDGLSVAYRAGARCFNLQYVQFHPTAFYSRYDRFLISESVRGEGGILVDVNGKQFMKDYHPMGDLASRDIVARGIYENMLQNASPYVYLDISHKPSDWIRERFPTIYKQSLERGKDITKEAIPVVPAAHYACGGVGVNNIGKTSLKRLYAVGEVSCTGVHGANRLASSSLLEAVVWGHLAGVDAAEQVSNNMYFPEISPWEESNEIIDPALIAQDWLTIKNTMWNYVGLIRTNTRLFRATQILKHLHTEIEYFYKKAKLTKETIQLRNGVQTAIAITQAAMQSKEKQLGCHFTIDE